jgi:sulfonate transport system permease protein
MTERSLPWRPRWLNLRALALPLALLGVLELWARTLGQGSDAVAPPSLALRALLQAGGDGSLLAATLFTLGSALLGLAIGACAGIPLGIWLGLSPRAARAGFLSIELLRPVPAVALIPLALLVFGFGLRMQLSVVAFASFWPMLVLAQAAARQVPTQLLEVAAALQLPLWRRAWQVVLPSMVARLFVALRLGLGIALVVAVTVEIAANPHGMGYALMVAQQSLEPALMMAWLFWIAVLGFAINAASLKLQAWVARRMGEGR